MMDTTQIREYEHAIASYIAQTDARGQNTTPGASSDIIRMVRSIDPTMHRVRSAMRRSMERSRRLNRIIVDHIASANRYTDETLLAMINRGEGYAPGSFREAKILLGVHPDDRSEVVRRSYSFMNATPDSGRWSDAVRACANDPDIRRVVS